MKNLRKFLFSFSLILLVAVCPIVMVACSSADTQKNENYAKAIQAAVDVLKENSQSQTDSLQASALSLEYEEVADQETFSQLFMIDYMKESGKSEDFDFPKTAFKAIMLEIFTQEMDYSIYGIHKYSVDKNNVSAEVAFSYKLDDVDYGFAAVDYEKINVEYDFDTNTLISFDWVSYLVGSDEIFHYVYENETLKRLVENSSDEYTAFKSQIAADAQTLFNTEDLTSKVYDFKSAYREVYNDYNGYYPDQQQ